MQTLSLKGELGLNSLKLAKDKFMSLAPGVQMEINVENEDLLNALTNLFTVLKALPVKEKHGDLFYLYISKPL